MPTHAERRIVPYTPRQMFDLVLDIERYQEFLPWCQGSVIRERKGNVILADLNIGFRMVRERFTSRVVVNEPDLTLDVSYVAGPLKYLDSRWAFVPAGADGQQCEIRFQIAFEFRNRLFEKLAGALFHELVYRMVGAFERRARQVHGPGSATRSTAPGQGAAPAPREAEREAPAPEAGDADGGDTAYGATARG